MLWLQRSSQLRKPKKSFLAKLNIKSNSVTSSGSHKISQQNLYLVWQNLKYFLLWGLLELKTCHIIFIFVLESAIKNVQAICVDQVTPFNRNISSKTKWLKNAYWMKESKTLEACRCQISWCQVLWYKSLESNFTKILQEFPNRLLSFPWLIMSPLSAPCLKLCCTMRELPLFTGGKYFYCKKRQSYFSIISTIWHWKVAVWRKL